MKTRNSHEAEPAERVELHGERVQKHDLDVEEDEEDRRQVEADREPSLLARRSLADPGLERQHLLPRSGHRAARGGRPTRGSWMPVSAPRRARRSGTAASCATRLATPAWASVVCLAAKPSTPLSGARRDRSFRAECAIRVSQTPVWKRPPVRYHATHGHGRASGRHPRRTLISLTPVAAAKIKDLLAEETDDKPRPARGYPGRRLLGLPVRPRLRHVAEGDLELELEGVPRRRRPVQRAVPPRHHDRLPEHDPGVGLQDRQPECRLVLRLRPLVPGRRGRGAARRNPGGWLRLGLLALTRRPS